MNFSDEASFVLDCSCIHPDQNRVERMRSYIAAGVNWIEVFRIAIPHGVLQLIGRNLRTFASDIVPAATLIQLELYQRRIEERNHRQVNELIHILEILSNENIRALPFKGPSLTAVAYGDMGLREAHDLDFWIDTKSLAAAANILRKSAYQSVGHLRGQPDVLNADRGDEQTEFMSADGKVLIELHDELQSRQFTFSPNFDEVWERRRELVLHDVTIPVFEPGDLLIALSVHGSKHFWRRLIWVADIAALIQSNPDIDWKAVLVNAKRWRGYRRLLSATALADDMYGPVVPDFYRKEFSRRTQTLSFVSRVKSQVIEGVVARTVRNFAAELRHHVEDADTMLARARITISYLKKLLLVQENEMLRPMTQSTLLIFRGSRILREAVGKLVTPD